MSIAHAAPERPFRHSSKARAAAAASARARGGHYRRRRSLRFPCRTLSACWTSSPGWGYGYGEGGGE
eukprot:scaffold55950_cov69-Phaeocystis_antarctica.AAC.3